MAIQKPGQRKRGAPHGQNHPRPSEHHRQFRPLNGCARRLNGRPDRSELLPIPTSRFDSHQSWLSPGWHVHSLKTLMKLTAVLQSNRRSMSQAWAPEQVEYQCISGNFTHADGKTSSALERNPRQSPFNTSPSNLTTRVVRRRRTCRMTPRSAHVDNRRVAGRTKRIRQCRRRAPLMRTGPPNFSAPVVMSRACNLWLGPTSKPARRRHQPLRVFAAIETFVPR